MGAIETIGVLFIAPGVIVAMMEYSLPGLDWLVGAVLLIGIGMAVIWFSSRHRKLRYSIYDNGYDDNLGHRPGSRSGDGIDGSADD